jgi:hypothetical protein
MKAKYIGYSLLALLLAGGAAFSEDVHGVIVKVDSANKELVLEGRHRPFKGIVLHLKLRDDTEILVGQKPGKIEDLVIGKHARVLFETRGNEQVILRVKMSAGLQALQALLAPESPEPPASVIQKSPQDGSSVSGVLRRVSLTDREIVVIGAGAARKSEVETTFVVPENVKISRQQAVLRFEDLREGQQVAVSGEKRDGQLEAKTIEVEPK